MRYLLFKGDHYYPVGGADDLVGRYGTIEEALAAMPKHETPEWAHIFDLETSRQGEVEWSDAVKGWTVDEKFLNNL